MAKHNILYLHNKSEISGGERSLLSLWENMDKWIFTPLLMLPAEGDLSLQAVQSGVKVFYYTFPKLRPWNIIGIVRTVIFLRKFLFQEDIHLIHSHTARNNIIAAMVGRYMKIPVIWHERNILLKGEWDVTKTLLLLPDAVICNSKAVARRLGALPSKVKVILNGVDLNKFTLMATDTDLMKKYNCDHNQIVGIVTNLTARRMVEYFIEVAALIKSQYAEVSFFIVGGEFGEASKGRLAALEEKSDDLGLKGSLFFVGHQDDVRPWIAMFDVSCHVTSLDACSRSVLEAMSMNRAIVAVNDGGNPELIENDQSGLLVEPGDQYAFANAVLSLLTDKEKRQKLGDAARIRVQKHFDIRRNVQETQDLYLKCIRGQ